MWNKFKTWLEKEPFKRIGVLVGIGVAAYLAIKILAFFSGFLFKLGLLAAFAAVIYFGYKKLTSGASKEKVSKSDSANLDDEVLDGSVSVQRTKTEAKDPSPFDSIDESIRELEALTTRTKNRTKS